MNEEKIKKAEMLLEAVGEIDDKLLDEALTYRRPSRIRPQAFVWAAAVLLAVCLTAGTALMSRIDHLVNFKGEEAEQPGAEPMYTLQSVLSSLQNREEYLYVEDSDMLPYLDGEAHIVWQYSSYEGYYVSDGIKKNELEQLRSGLGKGDEVGEESPKLNVKVWVLLGDGQVVSPYLKSSAGNISSEVFDYEAEIIPDDRFAERIQSILS